MGSTAHLLSDQLVTDTPKSSYETVPLFKPTAPIQIPFKVKQSYVDLLYAEIPTPDDSGPIRPEKKPWNLYGLLEDLNTASYSVQYFSAIYKRLCAWNSLYFDEICAHNQITMDQQKDALKLFFEMMKLQMMQHLLSVLTGKDEHSPKKSAEQTNSSLIKVAKEIAFSALATGTLVSEGSDGFLAGLAIAATIGLQGLAALPVAIFTGGANAYLHYAIDIRSSKAEVGVSTEEYIRPMTEMHRAQMTTVQRINDILRQEGHKNEDLAQMIDCANIATQFNDSMLEKNQGVTEYEETTGIKVQRTVLGLVGAGIVGTFSYLTLSMAFFGLSALFGPVGLIVFAATFAVLAGLCYFVSSMPLGLFSLFNPDAKEVEETRKMVVTYDERNKDLTRNLNEKIMLKITTQEEKLSNAILTLDKKIQTLLSSNTPVNPLTLKNQAQEIKGFTTQLNKLLLSCKHLSPRILSKKELKQLKDNITLKITKVSELHHKLNEQNNALITAAQEKEQNLIRAAEKARKEKELAEEQLKKAQQTIEILETKVDKNAHMTKEILHTKIEDLLTKEVSYLNTNVAEVEKLQAEVRVLTEKNKVLELEQATSTEKFSQSSDKKLKIYTEKYSPSSPITTSGFFTPSSSLDSPVFSHHERSSISATV